MTAENKEFWEATAEGRLLLRRCDDCGTVIWYPRGICPDCASQNTSWFDSAGRGAVYAYTIVHRSPGPFRGSIPYVIAYIELDEGPRVLSNVVGCDPVEVEVGMPVEVVWDDTGAGSAIYRFKPSLAR